jgi:hypothetical protein
MARHMQPDFMPVLHHVLQEVRMFRRALGHDKKCGVDTVLLQHL